MRRSIMANERQGSSQDWRDNRGVRTRRAKRTPFWSWFLTEGSRRFREMYGCNFDRTSVEHKLLITELWLPVKQSLPPRRGVRYDDSEDITYEELFGIQGEGVGNSSYESVLDPKEAVQEIIEIRRSMAKQDLFDRLRNHYELNGVFPDVMMQFITVFPYIRMPSVDDEILVYPAEISITHFSLYRGTMSCWSSLVDFDPIYLGVNRHRCDYNVVEKNAAILGIHHPMTRFCTPFDVFKRLMEKQCSPGVFVCDAEQVEIVERALAFLASTVTLKEQREHADVLERMVTAQDFITDLLQLYFDLKGTPVPHHLRDELIILEFNSAREKLWKFSRLCCYHERKPTGHESRKHCPVSRTAVLIAAVCKLSFSANMDDFRDHYDASKYLMERVSVNRLQNDSSLSKSTEHVLHNKTAAADGGATDKHIMANASTNFKYLPIKFQKLRYEVVKAQENPFQRRTKVKLDLIDAINRMRKLVS